MKMQNLNKRIKREEAFVGRILPEAQVEFTGFRYHLTLYARC